MRWSRPPRSGASSNCPIHMVAIARHMGVEHSLDDWQRLGPEIPLLVDVQPAGRFLGEKFHRAGGVPAVLKELLNAGRLHGDAMTVTGRTVAREFARRAGRRPRGDPLVRQSDAGSGRLRGDVGQHLRQRRYEDQRHRPGFPQRAFCRTRIGRTCSRARRSCSKAPRTITTASRTPISMWKSSRC